MNRIKLNKDQIQKIGLSVMGFVFLLYVYFSFFLGPLNRSRYTMLSAMKDKQTKLDSSKSEMEKASTLEQQAKNATARFAALRALSPEGAPIAWFPPRIRLFFANQQIDKAVARLETTSAFREAELANWARHTWIIELPGADYATLGKAIAELENTEPLLSINKLTIRASAEQPQYQQVALTAVTYIPKK
jgi:hypothetical protein